MAKQHLIPYEGPARTILPGKSFDYDRDFVTPEGPRGFQNQIHRLSIILTANFDDVTGAAIAHEDLAMLCSHLLVADDLGDRIDLEGDQLRAWMFEQMMSEAPRAGGDVQISAVATTGVYRFEIPFALPRLERRKDSALPVDHWLRPSFRFRIRAANNTDIQTTGTYTINASAGVTVRVIAWCAEEFTHEIKSRWVAKSQNTEDDQEFAVEAIAGRPLVGVFLHKRGVNGGASLANIDEIRSRKLGIINIEDAELETGYTNDRDLAQFVSTTDPFDHAGNDAANAKAFPLFTMPAGSKMSQTLVSGSNIKVRLTESATITNKQVVKTYFTPKSTGDIEFSARARGIDLSAAKDKTLDGKALSTDDPFRPFLPQKVSGKAAEFRGR